MNFGWSELLVIGVVALIVVGPKDLPMMFRAFGKFTGKMRRMARDFQRAMEDAADETGMRETASDLRKMTSPKSMGLDKLNEAARGFDKWEPDTPAKPDKGPEAERLAAEQAAARAESLKRVAPADEPAPAPAPKESET